MRYLNPRLRCRYFRFLKTNGSHIGILLPVLIWTYLSLSGCHFASTYQISFNSNYQRQSHDVISIFKVAAMESQIYSWLQY